MLDSKVCVFSERKDHTQCLDNFRISTSGHGFNQSLRWPVTYLMGVVLQNWRALGLMTAEIGGETKHTNVQRSPAETPTCAHPDHWSPTSPGILPYPIVKMADT